MKSGGARRGFLLLETAIALPILGGLLLAAGFLFLTVMKSYVYAATEAEILQEVGAAFQRIVEETKEAEAVRWEEQAQRLTLYRSGENGRTPFRIYWLHKKFGGRRVLVESTARLPMTGESEISRVDITKFSCEEDASRPGMLRLELEGRAVFKDLRYRFTTEVYLRNEGR